MSILGKHWHILNTDLEKPLLKRLLENRNVKTQEEIDQFFSEESLKNLHDPFLLKGMEEAIQRIDEAIQKKERIIIFGDYDVDGITATAIVFQTLKNIGANVSYRLPDRYNDGYGLNTRFVEEFREKKVGLVITVDCGISCAPEIELAKSYGIDVIITDHHSVPPDDRFPHVARAIIHPKQPNCPYPCKEITGAGVALKLAQALHTKYLDPGEFESFMDLAGLGTIADCAPLIGENRFIVKHGLTILKNTKHRGLRHLKETAGIDDKKKYTSEMLGFHLGPRINAAGRMDSPYFALQLLLSDDDKAMRFAKKLEQLNKNRQKSTSLALEQVKTKMGSDHEKNNLLIAYDETWSSGIIGLLAGKMVEKYGKPCIIMEDRGEILIGSMRAPEYFSCIDFLNRCRDHLDRFGGHKQAGGFNLKKEFLETFLEKAHEEAEKMLQGKEVKNTLKIDTEIDPAEIHLDTLKALESFEPFGIGNERPTFLLKDFEVIEAKTMGKDGKHLHLFGRVGLRQHRAFAFHFGQFVKNLQKGTKIDIIFHLEQNDWNGKSRAELKLIDWREKVL